MNEALRVDYLEQLGVVSWMPRQPLPGALPSEFFTPEVIVPNTGEISVETCLTEGVLEAPVHGQINNTEAHSVSPSSPIAQSMGLGADNTAEIEGVEPEEVPINGVNRVPAQLRLGLIRTSGPLIISNITAQDWPDHQVLPLVNNMLHFMQLPAYQSSLPFEWPFPGAASDCSESEFLSVLKALLSGARLQCRPGQSCWWFGELPDVIKESGLLQVELHHSASLVTLLQQPVGKAQLLHQLLQIKPVVD